MKLRSIMAVFFFAVPVAHADEKPADKTTADAQQPAKVVNPGYDTSAEIKAMPVCKAVVKEHHACYSMFATTEGKVFYIGSPSAGRRVILFLRTLKEGETYEFPGMFAKFEKSNPAYETVEQIKAMPACKATLDEEDFRHGSSFITSDGKTFYLGGGAEVREITEFVRSLKDGQSYDFPGAFIEFQKKAQNK